MSPKIAGVDELKKEAEGLQKSLAQVDETNVAIDELFPEQFMRKYTHFTTIHTFFNESPIAITDISSSLQRERLNTFTSKHTAFDNFDEMLNKACEEWVVREIEI